MNFFLITINRMVTADSTTKKVLLHLLRDFSSTHIITSLARELNLTRVGIWKVLKRLEKSKYILLKPVGKGKTSTYLITLNWNYPLVEKTLSLYLTEEAIKHRRWQFNFAELEGIVHFLILYGSILHSPQQANDIDITGVVTGSKRFIATDEIINRVQITLFKKIHPIFFGPGELKKELLNQNRAFIDAIRKGVILFGQENFVKFMKEMAK